MTEIIEPKPTPRKRNSKEPDEPLIYCGPTIATLNLRQFDTFSTGIPARLETVIKKNPALKKMFKPASKLVTTRQNLKVTGSADYLFYKKLEGGLISE